MRNKTLLMPVLATALLCVSVTGNAELAEYDLVSLFSAPVALYDSGFGLPAINNDGVVAVTLFRELPGGIFPGFYTHDGTQAAFIADFATFDAGFPDTGVENIGPFAGTQPFIAVVTQGGLVTITADGNTMGSYSGLGSVAINNFGQVVFFAEERATGRKGLFTGDDPVNDKIIQVGDFALGGVISDIQYGPSGFNDRGQVALLISTGTETDGTIVSYIVIILPEPVEVAIDIKPGSDPSCFNINDRGTIPVAILGSDQFDVTNVDPDTLLFAGLEVRTRRKGPMCRVEDFNNDGFPDLVCHFEDDSTNWSPDSEDEATLTGQLFDGTEFMGTDSICVVP